MCNDPIETKTAAEFLAMLRRSNPTWTAADGWQNNWIFRGQPCASFKLVPTLWRDDVKGDELYKRFARDAVDIGMIAACRGIEKQLRKAEVAIRQHLEFWSVKSVCDFVDELGFPIPAECRQNHSTK
jgi:hypothetical protein